MKGSRLEHLIEVWLMMNGWTTHRAAPSGIRAGRGGKGLSVRSNDIFGCLDVLAIRRDAISLSGLVCVREKDGFVCGSSIPCEYHGDRFAEPRERLIDCWAIQSTTTAGRSARRGKVAKLADRWPRSWRVSVVTMKGTMLEIEDLVDGNWTKAPSVPIDQKAVRLWWKKLGDSVIDKMLTPPRGRAIIPSSV